MSWNFYTPSGGIGTSFPGSPNDKDIYTWVADASAGVLWTFRYYEATTKWMFIGGAPLFSQVLTSEGTSSASYTALTTAGPSLALPFAGDYDITIGANLASPNAHYAYMSYDIGVTGASDSDCVFIYGNAYAYPSVSRLQRKTGLSAVTLTMKYRVGSGTGYFEKRWMAVTPVQK